MGLVLIYGVLFFRGAVAVDRYKDGFPVKTCPICGRGELTVETRVDRLLGIPRVKRIVRCSDCRSVLREVGLRRWRYAVDRLESPALYQRYNNRTIDESALASIDRNAGRNVGDQPAFTDDGGDDTP